MALADFNVDGKLDITVCSETTPKIALLLGIGDGTFRVQQLVDGGPDCSFIAAADLNGDRIVDLATSNHDATATVLLGKVGGGFETPISYPVRGPLDFGDSQWLALADLNGDGALDLVVSVYGGYGPDQAAPGRLAVLINNGSGSFADAVFYPDRAIIAVVAGDFDRDGKADVATADFDETVRVFLGDGAGRLGTAAEYPIDGEGVAIATGDVNGDGVLDLAVGGDNSRTAFILVGKGDGTFDKATKFAAGNNHAVAIADLDRDGHPDLLSAGYDETFVRLWPGRGDGTFKAEIRFDTNGATARGIAAADFNGDSKLDLVVADAATSVYVILGK
ncbi:MAG: VCBS repeat-containing protein [Chloroflexota bacterium]